MINVNPEQQNMSLTVGIVPIKSSYLNSFRGRKYKF